MRKADHLEFADEASGSSSSLMSEVSPIAISPIEISSDSSNSGFHRVVESGGRNSPEFYIQQMEFYKEAYLVEKMQNQQLMQRIDRVNEQVSEYHKTKYEQPIKEMHCFTESILKLTQENNRILTQVPTHPITL